MFDMSLALPTSIVVPSAESPMCSPNDGSFVLSMSGDPRWTNWSDVAGTAALTPIAAVIAVTTNAPRKASRLTFRRYS